MELRVCVYHANERDFERKKHLLKVCVQKTEYMETSS